MLANLIYKTFGPLNLVGPIFGKELRIASRRRRNYLLRSFYVLVLTVFVAMVWYASVDQYNYGGSIYTLSRMSRVGVQLLITIGIFQFIALQIISPVLTCTAISDEINHSTLGVLMMTPITSLQIVVGKLMSKMLTVMLLICASLPILAVIRIFGGIDWYYVIQFIVLTLCASLFAASISLAFSIFHKKAYSSIIMTYITLLAVYLLIPLLLAYGMGDFDRNADKFVYFNPFMSLMWIVTRIENAGGRAGIPQWGHPAIQCALLLGATFLVVLFSSVFVRRVALRMTGGENVVTPVKRKLTKSDSVSDLSIDETDSSIVLKEKPSKPVTDRPVLWRELHIPLMGTEYRRLILFGVSGILMVWTYWRCWDMMWDSETHITYTLVYMLLAFITAAILSATTITSEKEASTWQALLTTPLSSREIINGKIAGVINRLLVFFLLYFAHLIVFVAVGMINSLALILMTPIFVGPIIFLIGTGTLISAKVKHTTTAVILNIGVGIFIWAILPFLLLITGEMLHAGDNMLEASLTAHPVALDFLCLDNTTGNVDAEAAWSSFKFRYPRREDVNYLSTILRFMIVGGIYTLTGVFCIEWSIRRLKRREI